MHTIYANASLFMNITNTPRDVYVPHHHIYHPPVIHHPSTRFSTALLPLSTSLPFFPQPAFEVVPSRRRGPNRSGGANRSRGAKAMYMGRSPGGGGDRRQWRWGREEENYPLQVRRKGYWDREVS